jgi:hypothetical protein
MRKERRAGKVVYVGDAEAPTPPWRDRDNSEERGLLDYEKCTAAELMLFIQSRGLSMPITTLPKPSTKDALRDGAEDSDLESVELNKKDYIVILQQADDAAVFDRFLQLAPELRTIVYQIYYGDFARLPTMPHQPPLTLVSKDIHAEALPIFYTNCTFFLRLHENLWEHALARTPLATTTHNNRNDPDLLTSSALSASNLSRITRIHLRLHSTHPPFAGDSGMWDIDLGRKAGLWIQEGRLRCGSENLRAVRHERIWAAIRQVFLGVWARSGSQKFRRGDIEDLRAAVHEALALLPG